MYSFRELQRRQRGCDLIKANIWSQLLCQEFDRQLRRRLKETTTSIEQQTTFHKIAATSKSMVDHFLSAANNIEIPNAKQLINYALIMLKFTNALLKYKHEIQLTRIEREQHELEVFDFFYDSIITGISN